MPANLTPEYARAEAHYREATSDGDRLMALQEMLAAIPKHKGTEKLQADLKRRLAQARREAQRAEHNHKGPDPFHIPRRGAGQIALVGPPNTGKSSLLNATTHAGVKVADYPFTTTVPHPGMWTVESIPLELVDTPPLTLDHVPPGLLGTLHGADIVCVVVEAGNACLEQLEHALHALRERGMSLHTHPVPAAEDADPSIRPGLVVANKIDLGGRDAIAALRALHAGSLEVLEVSALTGTGLDAWFQRLWRLLGVIRVFAKEPGQPTDRSKPFVLPSGSTVVDFARLIHRDLPDLMKSARLWGHSRFDGQTVPREEPLQDGDAVEIHR